MTNVLLFHHAHGLTDGVRAFGDRLAAAGHAVTTPDLYDGVTFSDLEEGIGHAQRVGSDTIAERGAAVAAELPADLVYVGFSLGGLPAQQLAQTRPGARAAVLVATCFPATEFGDGWPAGVPVQVHGMEHDPYFTEEDGDLDAARDLVAATEDAELFLYPGDAHLFADPSLPGYDAAAADLLTERVLALLARVG